MAEDFPNLRIGVKDKSGVFITCQPIIQRINKREFVLIEPYYAIWDGGEIAVPKGFKHDLASIPRIFWTIVPKSGLHDGPAVIHDWCYVNLWRTRRLSDLLFLCLMKVVGSWWLRRNVMWCAVRSAGWYLWNRRARRQKSYNEENSGG